VTTKQQPTRRSRRTRALGLASGLAVAALLAIAAGAAGPAASVAGPKPRLAVGSPSAGGPTVTTKSGRWQ
jgi:hypothetical protein